MSKYETAIALENFRCLMDAVKALKEIAESLEKLNSLVERMAKSQIGCRNGFVSEKGRTR